MGWAARGLGLKIDEALKEYRRHGDMTPVREAMRLAYGDETIYVETITSMGSRCGYQMQDKIMFAKERNTVFSDSHSIEVRANKPTFLKP